MTERDASAEGAAGRRNGIQVVARVGQVLRALESSAGGLSLSELAATLDLPKSTVHRLVSALETEELVATSGRGPIRLGRGIARMGAATREDLRDQLHPLLQSLRNEVEETVDLAVLDGSTMRFIDQIPARHRLRAVSAIGSSFPLHCTANGKAMLGALPRQDAEECLPARLASFTAHTITTRAELWREIDTVAATGVAIDREEHSLGICAVGAVIVDPYGPVAAISVPVPAARFAGQEARLATAVRATARSCSEALGGLGSPRRRTPGR